MKKQTLAIDTPYQQPDAYEALSMPVCHCAAYEFGNHSRGRAVAQADAELHRRQHRLCHQLLPREYPRDKAMAPASLLPRMARLPRPRPQPPATR